MALIKFLPLVLISFAGCSPSIDTEQADNQPTASPAEVPNEEVAVRFVAAPNAPDEKPLELQTADGSTIAIELPSNNLSPVYQLVRPAEWIIGKTNMSDDGQSVFQPLGRATSSPGREQLIVVIHADSGQTNALKLVPLITSTQTAGGSYSLFNASELEVGGSLSAEKFVLAPGAAKALSPSPSESKGTRDYCYARFFFIKEGQTKQPFYSSAWRLSDRASSFVFFYHEPHHHKLKIHTIRNYLP